MSEENNTTVFADERDSVKRLEQALMLSSMATAVSVILLFFNVIFSLTLMQLSSKVNVLPYLIFEKPRTSDDIVTHEIFDPKMTSIKDICEVFVRRYLELEFGFFKDEEYMKMRWGRRSPIGGAGFFRKIDLNYDKKFYKDENHFDQKMQEMMTRWASQKVFIKRVIPKQKGRVWDVEFGIYKKSTSNMSENVIVDDNKRKMLAISFVRRYKIPKELRNYGGENQKNNLYPGELFINPLGIAISSN